MRKNISATFWRRCSESSRRFAPARPSRCFWDFLEAGVPLGTTFSFLVASPMINEVALVLLFGMFGWKIALLYIVSGLVIAILSGIVIGHLKVENLVEEFVL